MSEQKKCPVDRGKILIALECCRRGKCGNCPYGMKDGTYSIPGCDQETNDVLAYIGWLEEKLEGKVNAEGN